MISKQHINNIFTKKEINYFWILFVGIFFTSILDVISFGIIIPVFNIIFLDKVPLISLYFINIKDLQVTFNLKIILLAFFVSIFYLKNILIIIFNFFFIDFFRNIHNRISNDLFSNFLNQSYDSFLKKSSENFLQKVNNDVALLNAFLIAFINFLIEFIFLILISLFLLIINYKIFLICFISFFFILLIYYKLFQNRLKKWSNTYRNSIGDLQSLIIEGTQGFKDIILYDLKSFFIKKFHSRLNDSTKTMLRIDFLNNIQKYWLELVAFSVLTISLIYFVITHYDVKKLIPVFGLFTVVMFRLLISFNKIINSLHTLKFNYPSFIAISKEFSEFQNNNDHAVSSKEKIIFNNSIEIKNVKFSYLKNSIFTNINFKINKGDCIAIVGENGSGKTTLLNLIAGLTKPNEGQIIIDNNFDIYSNNNLWFQNLSYVQQSIFLMDTTLKQNIILTSEDKIDVKKFDNVLNALKLEDFFIKLPDGLDTKVGINGISLSGGQKQIVSLARALYRSGDIIILDEATSALDADMIKLVKNLILSFKGTKTIIMVTHNLDYFLSCFDKIIKIENKGVKILKE
jgi:ABC-type multidrug transport system fused ATPase/permease subunit